MAGLLSPDVQETIVGSAEILEIFKVSKVGKVAGSKVVEGEITQNSSARVIRDGVIIFNGKIGSIFRELLSETSIALKEAICPCERFLRPRERFLEVSLSIISSSLFIGAEPIKGNL